MKLETVRILKKLDGFSVLLALMLAQGMQMGLFQIVYDLGQKTSKLLGAADEQYAAFPSSDQYVQSIITLVIWLVGTEAVLQVAKVLRTSMKKK